MGSDDGKNDPLKMSAASMLWIVKSYHPSVVPTALATAKRDAFMQATSREAA